MHSTFHLIMDGLGLTCAGRSWTAHEQRELEGRKRVLHLITWKGGGRSKRFDLIVACSRAKPQLLLALQASCFWICNLPDGFHHECLRRVGALFGAD